MQNIRDSMTTYMRWHGNSNRSKPVEGLVHRYTICVQVRWGYLAYSGVITFLLLVFFTAMIFNTRSVEPAEAQTCRGTRCRLPAQHDFKSLALATLFHGLDRRSHEELQYVGVINTVRELEDESKSRLMRLVRTARGWKLSSVQQQAYV